MSPGIGGGAVFVPLCPGLCFPFFATPPDAPGLPGVSVHSTERNDPPGKPGAFDAERLLL